ncbi:MAG: dynamin family protein [Nocardioides sp.]
MTTSSPADPEVGDSRMVTALVQLHQALVGAELPFLLPGTDDLVRRRREMIDQLEDYVIPRVMTLESPMLAVVGGSTGAGKSTLVNSLVGHRVTTPGVLRPTTRSPVLVHHPDDATWFGQDRLLPDLTRVDHSTDDPSCLQLVPTTSVPQGLAILDAPDVDSVEERNRQLAAQLMQAADLWLFVTSAARYADQVPWAFLRQAAERSTAVAVILDRTPDEAIQTVATHLARMLASRGLKDSPLFTVTEGKVNDDGLLPAHHVAEVRGWLESLAADTDARSVVVRQTLDGAVRTITRGSYPVADMSDEQTDLALQLRDEALASYGAVNSTLASHITDGTVVQGEVLIRWQEFIGTGELLTSLESRVGGIRDRLVNTIKGNPQQAERLTVAIEAGVETLLLEHGEAAAAATHAAWIERPAGVAVLAGESRDLSRASRDLRRKAERMVRDWQLDLLEMVRADGADRRTSPKFLAFGVNGLSAALMVAVLARSTEEIASAALARRLLESVFGDTMATSLIDRGQASLTNRIDALIGDERDRYVSLVDGLALHPTAAERLRQAARRVDDLRYEASVKEADPGDSL